jgi:branched-chain amino acid transport system ATP-binding protein
MSLLRVESVGKSFGGLRALSDVSLTVEEGQIVGLIGPNGAGKTTLFNVVAGTLPADRGRIIFNGTDITRFQAYQIARTGLARTFQITRPFLNMTCEENAVVAMIGSRVAIPRAARGDRVGELLNLVGLAGKEKILSKDLNLIDKKRLELARALTTEPRLILLDEVLGGLSSLEMAQALELIRTIRDRLKITVLWIEHVMGAIMSLSERVFVLDQGMLICEGPPDKVARDPNVIQAYLGEADAQD